MNLISTNSNVFDLFRSFFLKNFYIKLSSFVNTEYELSLYGYYTPLRKFTVIGKSIIKNEEVVNLSFDMSYRVTFSKDFQNVKKLSVPRIFGGDFDYFSNFVNIESNSDVTFEKITLDGRYDKKDYIFYLKSRSIFFLLDYNGPIIFKYPDIIEELYIKSTENLPAEPLTFLKNLKKLYLFGGDPHDSKIMDNYFEKIEYENNKDLNVVKFDTRNLEYLMLKTFYSIHTFLITNQNLKMLEKYNIEKHEYILSMAQGRNLLNYGLEVLNLSELYVPSSVDMVFIRSVFPESLKIIRLGELRVDGSVFKSFTNIMSEFIQPLKDHLPNMIYLEISSDIIISPDKKAEGEKSFSVALPEEVRAVIKRYSFHGYLLNL